MRTPAAICSAQARSDSAALEDELLVVAIQAAAMRAHISETHSTAERDLFVEQLERAEALRVALEQQVRSLAHLRKPWWRRVLG